MSANDSIQVQFVSELPPRSNATESKWDPVAEALRGKPQEWAFLGVFESAVASNIENAVYGSFRPAGSFEAVTRNSKLGRGEVYLYARYVGVSG